jgi:hypothetical protein
MKNLFNILFIFILLTHWIPAAFGQDTTHRPEKRLKNVIRYDLSGGLLFGVGQYVVLGYERVISPHQSISLNVGRAGLPKFVSVTTDSFDISKDIKNTGFNISLDYRFYLAKENKYEAPHGLYIGPYISYNYFHREVTWNKNTAGSTQQPVNTKTDLYIFTVGGEIGYQFLVWKRLAIDLVMIGPGISRYELNGQIESGTSSQDRQQLLSTLEQLITQKFPGMNYVFSGKQFDGNGHIRTTDVGFRYIIHLGFAF